MPVSIDSNLIVPAPTATFSKAYLKTGAGKVVGADYTITLVGLLIDRKGSPTSSGTSPTVTFTGDPEYSTQTPDDDPTNSDIDTTNQLTSIMKKQELLRSILVTGNSVLLHITGYNEDRGIKAYCDVEGIDFDDQSRWTSTCGYTITLKATSFTESSNSIFSDESSEDAFTYYVSAADESWSMNETDSFSTNFSAGLIDTVKRIYTMTHNVSAVGQRAYVSGAFINGLDPWQQASGYVHDTIGIGTANAPTGWLDPYGDMGYNYYNHKFTENIDQNAGNYSVSEEWTLYESGAVPATEEVSFSIDSDLGAINKISINGTVQGLAESGTLDENSDKYTNALSFFNSNCSDTQLHARASGVYGGTCLNTASVSKGIGHNPNAGTISYALTFDTRPSNIISGALTEDITYNDTYPGQLFSVTPVIGRSQPILQYVNSRSEYKRALQVNVVMPVSGCTPVKPTNAEMTTIFNTYNPTGEGSIASKTFYGAPQETFNVKTGQYSFAIDWTFEK